jgi:hypothetical protein
MLKQSSSRMKKVLAILLAVLFVVSLTAVAVSAAKEMKDPSSLNPDMGGGSLYGFGDAPGDAPCHYIWYGCGTPYGCPYCINYPINPYSSNAY